MINYLIDMIVDMNNINGVVLYFDRALMLSMVCFITIEVIKLSNINKFNSIKTSFINNDIRVNILLIIKYLVVMVSKILIAAISLLGLFNANLFNVKAGDLYLILLGIIIIKFIINLIVRFIERKKINRTI